MIKHSIDFEFLLVKFKQPLNIVMQIKDILLVLVNLLSQNSYQAHEFINLLKIIQFIKLIKNKQTSISFSSGFKRRNFNNKV